MFVGYTEDVVAALLTSQQRDTVHTLFVAGVLLWSC